MRITVKAHPKARHAKLVKKNALHYEIWVTEPPDKGRANKAILAALSLELRVPKSTLTICVGQTSRNKVIETCLPKGER